MSNSSTSSAAPNGWKPEQKHCIVHCCFIEVDGRRDVSNIYGGLKWLLDGLSKPRGIKTKGAGAIWDDSPKWVTVFPSVAIDKDNPGVDISIIRDIRDDDE